MNYNKRQINRTTARIVFQYDDKRYPTKFLKIWSIRKNYDGSISRAEGIVLGPNRHHTRALVVKVKQGDTIVIFQQTPQNNLGFLSEFKISETFEPITGNVERLREMGAALLFEQIRIDNDPSSRIEELDLKLLFQSRNPEWMIRIMSEQLNYWRDRSARKFLNVAPRNIVIENLRLLVHYNPRWALEEFKALLTREQVLTCIRKDPSAGMNFAFESIPRKLRKLHLLAHANHLLENCLELLTNSELRVCAKAAPRTAFLVRDQMPPRRRSIILARSFGVVWHTLIGTPRSNFRKEAIESLSEFPQEWLDASGNGFEEIFRKLEHLLGIMLEPFEIQRLLVKMNLRGQSELAKYISSHV